MQYDFSLAAGAAQSFDVVGTFVKYQNGTGLIRVRMSMGEYVDLLPGQGVFSVNYTRFTVTDRSGSNNAGALLAGDFDFRDSRITGVVEVIDGGRGRTLAGMCFSGGVGITGGSGTDYPHIVLNNPAGSGKRVVVEEFAFSFGGAGPGYLTAFIGPGSLGTYIRNAQNKISGAAASVASLNRFVGPDTGNGQEMYTARIMNDLMFKVSAREPIVIMPGYCFYMRAPLGSSNATGYVDFYEETI